MGTRSESTPYIIIKADIYSFYSMKVSLNKDRTVAIFIGKTILISKDPLKFLNMLCSSD